MGRSSNKTAKSGRLIDSTGQQKKDGGSQAVKSVSKKSGAARTINKKNQKKEVEGFNQVKRIEKKSGAIRPDTMETEDTKEEPDRFIETPLVPGKVAFQSVDSKVIITDIKIAKMIGPFARYCEDLSEDQVAEGVRFPLPKVEGHVLEMVIEWCEIHQNDPVYTDQERIDARLARDLTIPKSDKKLLTITNNGLSLNNFNKLTEASNFCEIPRLNFYCKKVLAAKLEELKTTEKIRNFFNIPSDWAPGQEEKIIQQQKWLETSTTS